MSFCIRASEKEEKLLLMKREKAVEKKFRGMASQIFSKITKNVKFVADGFFK